MRPLNTGIKGFKRLLKENKNLTKAQKNAAVRAYKARINERLLELKKQIEAKAEVSVEEKDVLNNNTDSTK